MTDFYQNQSGIINIETFDYLRIAIIGLGSIGSFLAVALSKLGFKNFILIDDDVVEAHNITTQYYQESDIDSKKAVAISKHMDRCQPSKYDSKVTPLNKIEADVVFVCVDSLKERKFIIRAILDSIDSNLKHKPKLIIDGRMHRLVFKIFTIPTTNQQLLNTYVQTTLEKEFVGACTEKGIIQNVYAIVAVMIEQFKKTLTGEPFHAVINCDWERYTFVCSDLQTQEKPKEEESDGN